MLITFESLLNNKQSPDCVKKLTKSLPVDKSVDKSVDKEACG